MAKIPGGRRQQKIAEQNRRYEAGEKKFTAQEAVGLVSFYKKKATRRLKTFYAESQRMDKKLEELLSLVAEKGYRLDDIQMNALDAEYIRNARKKTKGVKFNITARRDRYLFTGLLKVSPASMSVELNCPALNTVKTASGWALHHFKATYYRTPNIRDYYLSAVVGGTVKNGWGREQGIVASI